MLFREEDENEETLPFENRAEAGRILAGKLSAYAGRDDLIVAGLARGGVVVAFEIARALRAPLEVLVVSTLGSSGQKELAMGAIAADGVQVLDRDVVRHLAVSDDEMKETARAESLELQRREQVYRRGRLPLPVAGRAVILVDDGIATGSSTLAAIETLRRKQAAHVVVAVPVASVSVCSAIGIAADELICLEEPESLQAISQWYEDFSEVSDDEVCRLLAEANQALPAAA